jgi:Condensation domain
MIESGNTENQPLRIDCQDIRDRHCRIPIGMFLLSTNCHRTPLAYLSGARNYRAMTIDGGRAEMLAVTEIPALKRADLCWGQRYHWLRYQQVPPGLRHDAHIVANCPLPDGVSMTDLRTAMNHLVRRHEALRTVYDLRAEPWPQQLVAPPAPLPVREVTTEADGTPAPVDVIRDLTVADFDLARDWPIRACVVTGAGVPKRLVLVLNHIAFDDWSLEEFRREFVAMLGAIGGRGRATLPPISHQPTDLARHEAATPPATATLDHWRREVAELPADAWASRRRVERGAAGAHAGSFTSPDLLGATRALAVRHRTWPSTVHLAAYAIATAAYTRSPVVPFRWLTSHRDASPHAAVMTCMFSPTLISVDLSGDPTFGEVVRRIAARVTLAREHAYVPYDGIVEEFGRESFRRGQPIRVASEINFLSYPTRPCGARRDRFTRNPAPIAWAASGSDVYLHLHEWCDGVTVSMYASDAIFDADAVERFLRGYAAVIAAHVDEAADLRCSEATALFDFAPPSSRRLIAVERDVVDADGCEAVLEAHPAVRTATVCSEDGGLAAYVIADAAVTPAALRAHILGAMYDRPAVRCPDLFRICAVDGQVTEGDGRDAVAEPAGTDGEHAIATAVAGANGLAAPDLSRSYTAAGGRALRVPRVLATLHDLGWTGLDMNELASARPLRTLASRLSQADLRSGADPLGA